MSGGAFEFQVLRCATADNGRTLTDDAFGFFMRILTNGKVTGDNWESKRYEPSVTLDEQVEFLSLIGDVALKDGEPVVHAHAVVGKKDGTAHGGHLMKARIRPTCEVVLRESPAYLQKFIDPESGLALIKL